MGRTHNGAAAAIGFGVGALVGAAAASAVYPGYYDYGPDYAYATGYNSYAYEPAPAYYYRNYRGGNTPAARPTWAMAGSTTALADAIS